jgi:hypothetical protein
MVEYGEVNQRKPLEVTMNNAKRHIHMIHCTVVLAYLLKPVIFYTKFKFHRQFLKYMKNTLSCMLLFAV